MDMLEESIRQELREDGKMAKLKLGRYGLMIRNSRKFVYFKNKRQRAKITRALKDADIMYSTFTAKRNR